jgi:hypothetical protein
MVSWYTAIVREKQCITANKHVTTSPHLYAEWAGPGLPLFMSTSAQQLLPFNKWTALNTSRYANLFAASYIAK